jgi:hypothetical protein
MTYFNTNKFTYLAIDESPIGGNCSNLIIVGAESNNSFLAQDKNQFLPKAADYLKRKKENQLTGKLTNQKNPLYYPKLEELISQGLDGFSWIRANHGRKFSRQEFAHASIAELALTGNYEPQKLVLLIDSFFNTSSTKQILHEYLKHNNFPIPIENIECHDGGDRYIPLINFADLLAFRIGNHFRSIQKQYSSDKKNPPVFDLDLFQLPVEDHRIPSIEQKKRNLLKRILKAA